MPRNTKILPIRYTLSRLHLLERHVNQLYNMMKVRFPEETEMLDDFLSAWQREVNEMHAAFLKGDMKYFDEYERQYTEK